MIAEDVDTKEKLNSLSGIRLQIFSFLLQHEGPVGVRQTQRALNLKTASHANYHMMKLVEHGILAKTPQNSYYLKDEFKIKSLKINVLSEYYFIVGRYWPRSVFFGSYLLVSFLISIFLIMIDEIEVLTIYVILSSIISLFVVIFEIRKQIKAIPWEEE